MHWLANINICFVFCSRFILFAKFKGFFNIAYMFNLTNKYDISHIQLFQLRLLDKSFKLEDKTDR